MDLVVPQDTRNVGVWRFNQFQNKMLGLDIIVGAREAETRSSFQRTAACVVEPGNQ